DPAATAHGRQDRVAVPTGADRPVDIDASGTRGEVVQHLRHEDRFMDCRHRRQPRQMPRSTSFSAISLYDSSASSTYDCQCSRAQISARVETPMITTSFVIPACSRRWLGSRILPCLSSVHSVAPEKRKRTKARALPWVIGSDLSLVSRMRHSSMG